MPDDNEDLKRTERLQVMLDEAELTKIDDWRLNEPAVAGSRGQ